jgi:gliding motility-associated-like protein
MRKIITLVSLFFIGNFATAQNDAVLATPLGAITAPASGCVLTSSESVTIRIFNSGPGTITSPFYVSYNITGPVASYAGEIVPVGISIPPNSSYLYTFATTANLSSAGTYTMSDTVLVAGDPNAGNNTQSGYSIVLIPNSDGGNISGPSSVCITGNSGFLTLSGNVGSVLSWGYSTDGGSLWNTISNTSTIQSYNNLTVSTKYRAVVQNGACASAYSDTLSIAIDAISAGGTLSPAARTVCSGSSSGLMTLSGKTGSIIKWQYSTDNFTTSNDIAVTTLTYTDPSVTSNPTRYRVVIQNGACPSANSSLSTITASPPSVGGTVTGGATVCSGVNGGSLTLAGNTGSIQWQFSSTRTFTVITNGGTTATQAYSNLVATRYYRAKVTSGTCAAVFSNIDSIVVNPAAVGGTLSSAATVCDGSTSGLLTLAGYTGTVSSWEVSINGGAYSTIANTLPTYTSGPLTSGVLTNKTYDYRVKVMNGTCGPATSTIIRITVNPKSVGGITAPNDTVCSGSNGATINLSGNFGAIQHWQSSTNGVTWNNIVNITSAQTYSNLVSTTYYAAVVKNGVCPTDTSTFDTVTVNVPSIGGAVNTSGNICFNNNSGTLTLSGQTGTILRWEYSIDGGINWVAIANTTTSYIYTNITLTTQFRVVVQNGTCPVAYSTPATLTVDPASVGGTISGSTTACGGSNNGSLNLIGYVGTVQNWESSTDGGTTWTPIVNATAIQNYTNIVVTTIYRAIVASGVCSNDTSATATVTVDPPSVGGTLTSDTTICASSNSGTMKLTGYAGIIQNWQSSTDGGVTWLTLSNNTASQSYTNLLVTTLYRVFVKSGVCNGATSNIVTITVDPLASGGTLTGGTTVCDTINTGTLTLTGSVGTVQNWESSTDGGTTWTSIVNTTTSYTYTNLKDTTWFRVIVMSGVCGNDTSSVATIYIDPKTVGGIVSMSDTVCSGTNSGTLHLTGYTGTVVGWELSTDGGFNWIPINNTTDSLTYINLTTTTLYHAKVKSGICNSDTSMHATITVNRLSAGGTLTGAIAGCEGANAGTLKLGGYVGTIQNWESSIDAGVTWTSITNITTTQSYLNLVDTTWYRVIVQSGVCAADTSSATTVIVYPKPLANYTADSVCFGNATTFINTSTVKSGFIQFNQWDFGDNTTSLSVNPKHSYAAAGTFPASLLVTSNFGCLDTAMVNVQVNILPPSTITASGPLTFCAGDSIALTAATGGYGYVWSTAKTTQSITILTSGTYSLTISDTLTGCFSTATAIAAVNPSPTIFAGRDTSFVMGKSVSLNASGVGVISWDWTPVTGLNNGSISNPVASPQDNTTYKVTGMNIYGCADEDSIVVTVLFDYDVVISNLMTPNGDGYNDNWTISNIEYHPNTEVVIVNREGQQVFKSESYNNDWDGTRSGKILPDGTYYYIIKFENDTKVYKGAITILKENSK